MDGTGNIYRVVYDDGVHGEITYENGPDRAWGLWCIEKDSVDYKKMESFDIDASDYKITTWAFMSADDTPTIALDATGVNIYGYTSPKSIITLSPVATETLCSIKGASTSIIGTDMYSDYPEAIKRGHEDRTISIVGSCVCRECLFEAGVTDDAAIVVQIIAGIREACGAIYTQACCGRPYDIHVSLV